MARIAIDAMGGDYAPRAIVEGALWAAQEYGVGLELVGRKDDIQAELDRIKAAGCIYSDCGTKGHNRRIKIDVDKIDYTITHASEVIGMGEAVGQSIRRKRILPSLHQLELLLRVDVKLLFLQVQQERLWLPVCSDWVESTV